MGRQEFDILLIDLNYARDHDRPDAKAWMCSGRLKEFEEPPPVVAMTGMGHRGLAVESDGNTA